MFYPLIWQVNTNNIYDYPRNITPPDSGKPDTNRVLPFPFNDQGITPGTEDGYESKLFLQKPGNIKTNVEYNHETNEYEVKEKIGSIDYRYPQTYSFEEYNKAEFDRAVKNYWRQRFRSENFEHQSNLVPQIKVPGQV